MQATATNKRLTSISPLANVVVTADAYLELARTYADQLGKHGWAASLTAQLEGEVQRFQGLRSQQVLSLRESVALTKEVHDVVESVGVFRGRLATAMTLAAESGLAPTDLRLFLAAVVTRRTSKVLDWLSAVRDSVAGLDAALRRFLPEGALLQVDALRARLSQAQREQQHARRTSPGRTQAVNDSGRRITRQLRTMRGVARIAFATDPTVLREFRLQRAKRRSPAPAVEIVSAA